MTANTITRRRLLQVGAGGLVTTTILGGGLLAPSAAFAKAFEKFTWISPRGTIEVMDDYPYWVAKEMGYFGDLGVETSMEPGPSDGTAVVKFVAVEQADIGFPSPGVLSFAVNNGMDLVSIFGSGYLDLFNIAFRKGEGMTDLKGLEGKTVLLGSAAWQAIADPMFAAVGVDPKKITYVEAGWPTWTTALAGGQGDALRGRVCARTLAQRVLISITGWGCGARHCPRTRW
jgi:NitT/TauT family transport system substrate-binding protein